jgi:transcription initiation factor TFIIIB Brf1 subunit/transcription initiation factor TFIIB
MDPSERHCPRCNDTDLVVESGTISCKKCDLVLSIDRIDAEPLEDQEWVRSGSITQ